MLFKTLINSAVYNKGVRAPKKFRLAGSRMDANIYKFATTGPGWHSSTIALGIAERAFGIVLDYKGERMGGFKPVRQYAMVAGILAGIAIQGIRYANMKKKLFQFISRWHRSDFHPLSMPCGDGGTV